jgi:Rod binding domain-containing protein
MSELSALGGISGTPIGMLPPKPIQMHRQSGSAPTETENAKIEKSAKDFESILLGSWLQQAEQSFATVPGGDGDADADAGKDQLQGMAMQSLGTSMTNSGGIGIASMIAKHLHKAQDAEAMAAAKANPATIKAHIKL